MVSSTVYNFYFNLVIPSVSPYFSVSGEDTVLHVLCTENICYFPHLLLLPNQPFMYLSVFFLQHQKNSKSQSAFSPFPFKTDFGFRASP